MLYPARRFAEMARCRRIHFHLDGALTFGGLDLILAEVV
jgi:hypothetical protein